MVINKQEIVIPFKFLTVIKNKIKKQIKKIEKKKNQHSVFSRFRVVSVFWNRFFGHLFQPAQ